MMNDSIPSIPTVVERKPDFVTDLELERRARGFAVRSLRPHTAGGDLDPFLGADIYVMSEPFFPPHPHAGFSAVTWMLSHSEGGFVNRDSLGEHCHVEAGDLLWTQAGSGVVHEEVPITRGVDAAGLQVFVKAPAARELDPPEVLRLVARDVPIARFEGGQVRVLVGEALGVTSPLRPNHPVRMLEVLLGAKGTVSLVLPRDELTLVLGVAGDGAVSPVDGTGKAVLLRPGTLVRYSAQDGGEPSHDLTPNRDVVTLRAGAGPLTVAILSGRPLHEPIVVHGPFAMSTRARLEAVMTAHRRGELGRLEASF